MSFRFRIAAWFGISLTALIGLMFITAHWHLDEELRKDRWDRSHPKYPDWVIHGSYTNEEVHDILKELLKIWLWTAVPTIGLSLAVGLFLAHRSVRPIRDINRQLADLTPESMRGGIHLPENDPVLSDLVEHINASLHRAGTAYEGMADFSSKVAHELRTPLTLLRMKIEQSSSMPAEVQEELQDELARLSRFIERSLLAAKAENGTLETHGSEVDVSKLLEDIGEGYKLLATERNLEFVWQISPNTKAFTDPDLLRQLLHNLLGNALRYAHSKIEVVAVSESQIPVITIANDYSGRTMGTAGLGLGLRLAQAICSATGIILHIDQTADHFSTNLRIRHLSVP